jgi:DNA-binding GntR family transcriptional regulator
LPDATARRQTKQELAHEVIRERIVAGQYSPGFRLVIDTLAAELGMSALPVREAVRRLEAEGLVVFRPNAGAQVSPADPELFEQELGVLAVLEGYATALAAQRFNRADLKALDAITDQMVGAMEALDALAFGRLNQEFHGRIHAGCPNGPLLDRLRESSRRLDALRRTVFVQIPYRGAASVREHRQLVTLMRKPRQAGAIEAAARAHKLQTVESFRRWRAGEGS